MKANNIFIALGLTTFMFCLSSCKNKATTNDASADDKKVEEVQASVETSANEQADATPLLSVAEVMEVYDNLDDTHYFENHFSAKGMKQLFTDDFKNVDSVPDGVWFTEVWGINMKFDKDKDLYEKSFTAEGDNALALVVSHTDDPEACLYFFNPKYQDIYLKQIEEQGFKHFVGDDEYGQHYDLYAKEGYKPGQDVDKVFVLTNEDDIYILTYLYM